MTRIRIRRSPGLRPGSQKKPPDVMALFEIKPTLSRAWRLSRLDPIFSQSDAHLKQRQTGGSLSAGEGIKVFISLQCRQIGITCEVLSEATKLVLPIADLAGVLGSAIS